MTSTKAPALAALLKLDVLLPALDLAMLVLIVLDGVRVNGVHVLMLPGVVFYAILPLLGASCAMHVVQALRLFAIARSIPSSGVPASAASPVVLYALLSLRFPRLMAWLRQTTTIAGIAGIVGTVVSVLSGAMDWGQAITPLSAAVVAIAMPGHPEAAESVQRAALAAVMLADKSRRIEAVQALATDLPLAIQAVDSLRAPPPA